MNQWAQTETIRCFSTGYETGHVSANLRSQKLLRFQTKPSSRQVLHCQHTMSPIKPNIHMTSIIYYRKHKKVFKFRHLFHQQEHRWDLSFIEYSQWFFSAVNIKLNGPARSGLEGRPDRNRQVWQKCITQTYGCYYMKCTAEEYYTDRCQLQPCEFAISGTECWVQSLPAGKVWDTVEKTNSLW